MDSQSISREGKEVETTVEMKSLQRSDINVSTDYTTDGNSSGTPETVTKQGGDIPVSRSHSTSFVSKILSFFSRKKQARVIEDTTSKAINSVREKLYHALDMSNTEGINIDDMIKSLTEPQLMWEEFFSGIVIDAAADAVEENLVEEQLDFTHSMEIASNRALHRLENVCNLPLKLILTPLQHGKGLVDRFTSLLEMQFGPLHAALQVGDVILEWNDSHLVRPYLCDYEDEIHVMQVDMQPHSEWVNYTTRNTPKMKEAAEQLDFAEQIDQIYMVTSKKKEMIDALIDVIIRYNKKYHYNSLHRNSQHFVIDALKALQVENPTAFTGGLSDYFKELVKGRTPSIPKQFKTHQDLDAYVIMIKREGHTNDMPQHDLEFILTLYFRFHLESKEELRKNSKALEEWKCQEANCQIKELEQLIEMKSLKIHGFKN